MQKRSNGYTFMFALAVCVACSLALSIVSEGLKDRRELNVSLDIKKNILKAVDLRRPLSSKAQPDEVLNVYREKIVEQVIDKKGAIVAEKKPADIQEGETFYPLYIYKEGREIVSYCFPIVGKGLWGPIYGYLSLEPDVVTVRGVTFYVTPDFKETPGLGAQITAPWFQNNFKGKKIWDVKTEKLKPIIVVKGKAANIVSKDKIPFYVDGISGATMTSKGVTATLEKWINIYEPFFEKIRKQ